MRRAIAAALVAVALAVALPARAQDEPPTGRFVFTLGARENIGFLGDTFSRGWLFGIEAGYQPGWFGLHWALLFGLFDTDNERAVDRSLNLVNMYFGARTRFALGNTTPRFLVLTGGLELERSNIPIDDRSDRTFLGPYVGLGLEQILVGRFGVSLETRYGLLVGGPQSLTLLLSFSFGSE